MKLMKFVREMQWVKASLLINIDDIMVWYDQCCRELCWFGIYLTLIKRNEEIHGRIGEYGKRVLNATDRTHQFCIETINIVLTILLIVSNFLLILKHYIKILVVQVVIH